MKPSLPQGTRDFGAETLYKRNYIFSTIKSVFETYGFEPLETPAMENLDTLMGKYGDEGDKLIFKVLNNGLQLPEKHAAARIDFEQVLAGKNNKGITERALRYDLTIPFARYVAMNHGQLTLPYKRYQMQPVWRADRPQKGRYREFYQCDADVAGSHSLWNEVELAGIYRDVFKTLNLPVSIRINSRKILAALSLACGNGDLLTDITIAIDKLDKIGLEKVMLELEQKGIAEPQRKMIQSYLQIDGANRDKMDALKHLLPGNEMAIAGLDEIGFLLDNYTDETGVLLEIDFTLARGLNYYTGIIFEIKAQGIAFGSIGGGGRYADLTTFFDVKDIPGVGISFGVDRIFDVLEALNLFPPTLGMGTEVLFFNTGLEECKMAYKLMQILRKKKIRCELFAETAKFDKQFKYAIKKGIAYAAIIGAEELKTNQVVLKNLKIGTQEVMSEEAFINYKYSES